MKFVEFFIQNEGKEEVCIVRNWNIRNIMNTIMKLDPQVGHGVVSYYFHMMVGNREVIVTNKAIRVNQEIQTRGEVFLDDSDKADDLFDVFMDTKYDEYDDTTICVAHDGDNLIRFLCDEIDVDEFNPVAAFDAFQRQWDRYSQDTKKYLFYICMGPNAGRRIYMTPAEALNMKIY